MVFLWIFAWCKHSVLKSCFPLDGMNIIERKQTFYWVLNFSENIQYKWEREEKRLFLHETGDIHVVPMDFLLKKTLLVSELTKEFIPTQKRYREIKLWIRISWHIDSYTSHVSHFVLCACLQYLVFDSINDDNLNF